MTRWSVETGSSLSVAAKVLLVGGRRCSLCAHSRDMHDKFGWWLFATSVDCAWWVIWPIEPVHTVESWEWWNG